MVEPTRTDPPLAALFILLFVALLLAVVALVRSANASPVDAFLENMVEDDYDGAALALADERGVEEWLARTEALALRHGEVEGFQRSDRILSRSGEGFVSVATLNWEDDFTRCLLLRQGGDGSLSLVGGYFDCDTLSERVPEGGQLLPEDRPPDGPGAPGSPEPFGPPSAEPDPPPVPDAPQVR